MALAAVVAAEEMPDAPRQPDRPPPIPRGFLAIPEVEMQEDAVSVDGFRLMPLGEAGSGWEFHPKALAGIAWDSNPLQAGGGSDADIQTRLGAGFEARLRSGDHWRTDLGGMLQLRHYADTPGRSSTDGEAQARLQRIDETSRVAAIAAFDRASDPLADIPEQVKRDRSEAGLSAVRNLRSSSWSGTLAWNRLDYREDNSYFGRDERDYQRWSATGSWQLLGGKESRLGAEALAESVSRPPDATANGYRAVTVQCDWRHSLGGRSSTELRLGATVRSHADDTADDPANDDRRILAPAASLRLTWGWEERSWLVLTASTGLVEGVTATANAARRDALECWYRLRLRDRLDLMGNAWLIRRTDSGAAAGADREVAGDTFLRTGLDYRLRDGLGVRGWLTWQRHASLTTDDYTRTLVALELIAAL